MFKTLSFWKTFATSYISLIVSIWGVGDAYAYFMGDSLREMLSSNWWMIYYVLPLFVAFSIATVMHARAESQVAALEQRNRQIMLSHVENFWIKGLLEKSLHGMALMELGIKENPSAVNYPWTIKRGSNGDTLPAGKSMLDIFTEVGAERSLLILGAPGSGKTTMLLELARQLILKAHENVNEPIPVVFNLASWKEKQSLSDWLTEQLNLVYSVPANTAPSWVSENKMLLLLDGLDEVNDESRSKCVDTINQFRKEYGLTSMVVCSRIQEYSVLNTKLALEGAITLQPLSRVQVEDYFDRFGESLSAVKQLLKKDKALRELAETPLMLSIMVLAYKGIKPENLQLSGKVEEQREHLFNVYIERMFNRSTRTAKSGFTQSETLRYLGWLARKMKENNITAFQIEDLRPEWLDAKSEKNLYRILIIFSPGLIIGVIGGMIFAWAATLGMSFAGIWFRPLPAGIIGGTATGILAALLDSGYPKDIPLMEKLRWSGSAALFSGLVATILAGTIALFARIWMPFYSTSSNFLQISFYSLLGGLVGSAVFGFLGGLTENIEHDKIAESTFSGQRLRATFWNFVLLSIAFGLIFGITFSFFQWQIVNPILRIVAGLGFGVIFGIAVCGMSLIQHFTLRLVLWRHQLLPRQLIAFLEYASGLIFMRRVGGSYIFIHRLLMEHFASLDHVSDKRYS